MKKLPERKTIRVENFDYSTNGAYFITICTKDKQKVLWNNVGADIIRPNNWCDRLSDYGMIVYSAFNEIPKHYDNVLVDKMVVMPNHIHVILTLQNDCTLHGRMISAPTKTVSTIMGQTKRVISKQIGKPIWQKSFHDHIIRNQNDYLKIWNYIDTNPAKWELDCYYE